MSKEKNIWDAKARKRERNFKEAAYHLTSTVPGSAVVFASGGLFLTNAYEAATALDASKIPSALSYYAFCLGVTALLNILNEEHKNS